MSNGCDAPCKNCRDRHKLCWDDCEDFKKFKEKLKKTNKNKDTYCRDRNECLFNTFRQKIIRKKK